MCVVILISSLLQMEKNAAAGRTPSSVSLSTPPPASLTLSSPKLAPLSPVHTNSLNDSKSPNTGVEPTNFTLPPSLSEDERTGNPTFGGSMFDSNMGDQRSDRLPTGGNFLFTFSFSTSVSLVNVILTFVSCLCSSYWDTRCYKRKNEKHPVSCSWCESRSCNAVNANER